MFDVAPTELLVLGTVALLVIPPKDLPRAMRAAGYWIGRARGAARQFRAGFDNIIRESELQEMEKKWAAENERIMREHPMDPFHHDMTALPPANVDVGQAPADASDSADAPPTLVEPPVVAPAVSPAPAGTDMSDPANKATS